MKLIVCVDDGMGVTFAKKRQSKDRVLRKRLLASLDGARLFVTPYTAKQFEEGEEGYTVHPDPVSVAGKEDFVFAEDAVISPRTADMIYLYRWNRAYPSDRKFNFDAAHDGFSLMRTADFEGSSHDRITEEIYIKK